MNGGGAHMIGIAVLAAAFYGVALIVLRKQPKAIRWFAIALCTIGLGYLATTPAPEEIARTLFGTPG